LFAAAYAAQKVADGDDSSWVPAGRFAWKTRPWSKPVDEMLTELDQLKATWPPIVAGVFLSEETARRSLGAVKASVSRLGWH
jgi:hypothetical protein